MPNGKLASRSTVCAFVPLVLSLASACAPSVTPTPPAPPNLPTSLSTSVASDARRTLPPEWTDTLTPTPSDTGTPTITQQPSPTPSLDDLCASLQVDFPYEDEHVFAPDESLVLFFGATLREWTSLIQGTTATPVDPSVTVTPAPTRAPALLTEPVMVRFRAVHRETGESLGAEAVGGEIMGMELAVSQLPLPGSYDWTVSVYVNSLGEQCAVTGTFEVAEGTDEP